MKYTNDINEAINDDIDLLKGFQNVYDGFCYEKKSGKFKIVVSSECVYDMKNHFRTLCSIRSSSLTDNEINDFNDLWGSFEKLDIDDIREKWMIRGLMIEGNFDCEEYIIDQGLVDYA